MKREEAKAILSEIESQCCDASSIFNTLDWEQRIEALDMAIKTLEQEPKTGHWILADEQNKEDVENDNYRFICSECQCSDIHAKGTKVPYCWKCGAKMVEPQESEDKE